MQLSELDWAYVQERAAFFTGRGWVFARLDQFLDGPPGVFLLLGEPGTGKTAVAAQLALAAAGRLTPAPVGAAGAAPRRAVAVAVAVAAAYFCRAGRVDLLDVAQRLSDQLAEAVPGFAHARQATLAREIHVGDVQVHTGDIAAGGSATGVHIDLSRLQAETAFVQAVTLPLKRAREAGDRTQVVLLVDALDESLASHAAKELPRLLGDVEYAHLVVTARPDRRAIDWLRERARRVDLLADGPPGSDDVLEYLQRRLTPEGEPVAMAILAQRIAEQASGNFLYAFYVIETLRGAHVLAAIDDAAARGVPLPEGGLTEVYRDFLRRELWRDDRAWSRRFGPVLATLAVAQDEGLTTEQLKLMADRLGEEPMTRTAIREVTRTARQFLDGPAPDGPFRVYHQSFADFLVDPEQNPDFLIDAAETHEAIVAAYAATDPLSWDSYARRNLALHASEAGQLDHLLEDARFLLAADPARLVPHLDAARSAPARATAAVYRQSAHLLARLDRPMRASQLELTAHHLGCRGLADRIATAAPDRTWQTRWSHGRPATGHQIIPGHDGSVNAVAAGTLPDGTPVIISAGDDGAVRVWRMADGTPVGEPPAVHLFHWGPVYAVAAGALPDGTPVIISGGDDRRMQVWRMADGTPVGMPLRGHRDEVYAVAAGALPDGTPVIISGGWDGAVRVWRMADGTPVGEPLAGHFGRIDAVAAGALPDGTPVIISGGWDGTVRVWRMADGTPVGEPLAGHDGVVRAVAAGTLPDGTPVIISGGGFGVVRVWRMADGTPVGEPLRGHDEVTSVAAGALPDGTPAIISGGEDGTVRVWRMTDGTPVGEPLRGHRGKVASVAAGTLPDGTPAIISGGEDGTVRVWRMTDGTPPGEPLTGHDGLVDAVAAGALPDGTPAIISAGGVRGQVRVWRMADGTPVGEPLTGHDGPVKAVAAGTLPDGTPVIISGGQDRTVRVWRTADGTPVGEPLTGHDSPVKAVAAGALPDGTPVIISGGGWDGTVRVWRMTDGTPVGEPLTGHDGVVKAVAAGTLPDGTPVIISGGQDRTVRVWRTADGTPAVPPLDLPESVRAVAVHGNGNVIITAAGADIAVHQPALPRPMR